MSFSRLDCDLRDLRGISSLFGISGSREKLRFDKGKYVFVARRRMGFSLGGEGKMEGVKEGWISSRFGKRFDSLFRGDFEVSRLT